MWIIASDVPAPGDLKLVRHQPWRRVALFVLTIVVGAVCLFVGFKLGDNLSNGAARPQGELVAELADAKEELRTVRDELIDVQLTAQVHRDAADTLRVDMTTLRTDNRRLEEEVIFYKSLMAPSALRKGLQVAELEVRPVRGKARQYRYEVLLTQVALRRTFISGVVRLDVVGRNARGESEVNGETGEIGESGERVVSLTELAEMKEYPLKFRFRFFQDLGGRFTLPDEFEPLRIIVTAEQRDKEPLQASFPWPAE